MEDRKQLRKRYRGISMRDLIQELNLCDYDKPDTYTEINLSLKKEEIRKNPHLYSEVDWNLRKEVIKEEIERRT